MEQEILFAKTLEKVRKQARDKGNTISGEDVETAFETLALKKEQLELVFDYLKKHGIGVDEIPDLEEMITEEEHQYLEDYLKEISVLQDLPDEERESVIAAAVQGDTQAKARLIEVFLPRVVEIAKLYTGQGVFLEDLIGEGNIALTIGVELLGALEDDFEAQGMLGRQIMDAMEALIAQNLEDSAADHEMANQVNRVADAARELAKELLRKVTVEELSTEAGMSLEEIREAMRISGQTIDTIE